MKKCFNEWWGTVFVGLGILVLALGLRIFRLTLLPVFADEAIYIRWSQVMSSEPTLRFLPLSDGKQPLFMWLLMFFVRRFEDPLFVGRMVSVLSGLGTMVGIFALSYVLFKSKKGALAASFFWGISPFCVFFDRMALVDALLASLTVWTMFFGVLVAKTKRLDAAMITGFFLGLVALTKSPVIFVAALLPMTIVVSDFPKERQKWLVHLIKVGALLTVSWVIAWGMYNILRLGPNFHLLSARTKDYVYPVSHLWENPLDPFKSHFHRAFEWVWIMGPGLFYVFVLGGIFSKGKKGFAEKVLLMTWFLMPLAIQAMYAKTFTARYIFYLIPPLYILAGAALADVKGIVRRTWMVLLVAYVFQVGVFNYDLLTDPEQARLPSGERSGYLEEWTAGTGIAEAAEVIEEIQRENPKTKIVVGTEGYFGTLPDGLQIYLNDLPEVTVIGVGLSIAEVPESLWESKEAGNKTYLLANTSRLNFTKAPEDYGYRLVEEWEKATRVEGTREYVKHGERDYLRLYEVVDLIRDEE